VKERDGERRRKLTFGSVFPFFFSFTSSLAAFLLSACDLDLPGDIAPSDKASLRLRKREKAK
jgi:hypothetical protein